MERSAILVSMKPTIFDSISDKCEDIFKVFLLKIRDKKVDDDQNKFIIEKSKVDKISISVL